MNNEGSTPMSEYVAQPWERLIAMAVVSTQKLHACKQGDYQSFMIESGELLAYINERKEETRQACAAPSSSPPLKVQRDSERLDWVERQSVDGIHIEYCHTGSFSGSNLKQVATVYVNGKEYKSDTVREAIDAAIQETTK